MKVMINIMPKKGRRSDWLTGTTTEVVKKNNTAINADGSNKGCKTSESK
jgi:hypothetical protein